MMLSLLAQTTQPVSQDLPAWAKSVLAIIGALTALILALGGGAGIMALIKAARVEGAMTPMNKSIDRLADRSNSQDQRIQDVAIKVDPNTTNTKPAPLQSSSGNPPPPRET